MSKCKSCGAEIIFVPTGHGKKMPCDARQIRFDEMVGGPDLVVTLDGEVIRGKISETGAERGYVSHFATCPDADKHRRK